MAEEFTPLTPHRLNEADTDGWNYYAVVHGTRHKLAARVREEAMTEAIRMKGTAVVKLTKETVWQKA